MKKFLAILLAVAMCASLLAGCGGSGSSTDTSSANSAGTDSSATVSEKNKTADELLEEKYAEPVKIKVVLGYRDPENPDTPDSVTPETQTAVKKMKEDLNIELEYSWIVNADQYEQKFGAELAAGNLPDAMLLNSNQFEDLYSQGGLGDFTDAYNKYANDTINSIINYDGKIIDVAKRDGKIYGLPHSTYPGQVTSQIYYRIDKLKEAGINSIDQLPKTIPEFEALCDKLLTLDIDGNGKTGDPVLPGNKWYIDAGLADFSPIFHAYKSYFQGWFDDGTGALQNAAVQPEFKQALGKLNEWYKKGYFAKDFAAQDVWGANSPVVSDIVSGKYAIVLGSWWIPNWPLNDNKKNFPEAEWVVGPTLTLNGETPTIMVPRYPVNYITAVSKDFKNPEAILKMLNWSAKYEAKIKTPEFTEKATEAEKLEANSYVYFWLPYRVYSPKSLIDNYLFVQKADKEGKTSVTTEEAPKNNEFWGAWSAYLATKQGKQDAVSWGLYTSRLDPNGGVARMYDLYEKAEKRYGEVYVTTPTMIKKQSEMDKYLNTSYLSLIMGQLPMSDFDKIVAQWKKLGGDEIQKEVNDWYKKK